MTTALSNDVRLSFERTISRRAVHKAAIEQVLLSDSAPVGDHEYLCAGQLPRAHSYFSDLTAPVYDPLLLLELARQGGVLVSHEYLGVPSDTQFIFSELETCVPDTEALERGSVPCEVIMSVTLEGERYRRGELAQGKLVGRLHLDRAFAMTVHGTATFFSRERYRALRKQMRRWMRSEPPVVRAQPLDPAAVGRRDVANVVVSEPRGERSDGSFTCDVIVDESHPTFFDHPLDHVPGVLLIEAFRQTAVVTACRVHSLSPAAAIVTRTRASYERLAELGAVVRCRAKVGPCRHARGAKRVTVDMSLLQFGSPISDAGFELSFASR